MSTADTDPSFPLPCPFCGAESIRLEWQMISDEPNSTGCVHCMVCEADGPIVSVEPLPGEDSCDAEGRCIALSYEAWNRRPDPDTAPAPKDPDQMEAGL